MKTRYLMVFTVCILLAVLACSKLQKNEWIDLTPGPNLEAWTIVDVPKDGPLSPTPQWTMNTETGILRCDGTGGRDWLRYDGTRYGDFIFHVEWKFDKLDEPAQYNSGVFVRNSGEGKIWHQVQMGSESGGFLFGDSPVNGQITRVSCKDQMKESPVLPAGEWNTFEVTCKGSQLSSVVNGVQTTVWENCEVLSGYVGLEAEGYGVEFRNIRIKVL